MSKRKIAVIGANVQQTPLIQKAKDMGFETYVFSWQTGDKTGEEAADFFYPISTGNKEAILEKCREIGVEAIVSIGSDISALTAAYVAQNMNLTSNKYSSLCAITNKITVRERLTSLGINQPGYVYVDDVIDVDLLNQLTFPLVVKPSDRSGGRGLNKVNSSHALYNAINHAREVSFEHRAIVEEYIDGSLYSCECISYNGKHRILGYTKRNIVEINGKICENDYIAPVNIPLSVVKQLETAVNKILDSFNFICGASSIEFIVSRGLVYIIEITPTMYGDFIGTDIIPKSYGYDYLKMVIDIASKGEVSYDCLEDKCITNVHFVYSREQDFPDAPEIADGNRYGHFISYKPIKEYGGTKPFIFAQKKSLYKDDINTVSLNSEDTAFWYALESCKAARVHIPYYCPISYSRIANELGVECIFYHIDKDFLPVDLNPGADDAVLLINYFGLCTDFVKEYNAKYKIIDNSTAFYEGAQMGEGIYNIYSCRKFFSVADGAYLVSKNISKIPLEKDVSCRRAVSLLISAELGENAAHKEVQTIEQELSSKRLAMSVLTDKMMSSYDYTEEKSKREDNLNILHSILVKYNLIDFEGKPPVSQVYPLLVNDDIRDYLVAQKIYVPLMWRRFICEEFNGTCERLFSEKLLCIPADSCYTPEDMRYIADFIVNLLS